MRSAGRLALLASAIAGCFAVRSPSEQLLPRGQAPFRDREALAALAAELTPPRAPALAAAFRTREGLVAGIAVGGAPWTYTAGADALVPCGEGFVVSAADGLVTRLAPETGNVVQRRDLGPRRLIGAGCEGDLLAVTVRDRALRATRGELRPVYTFLALRGPEPIFEIEQEARLGGPALAAGRAILPLDGGVALLPLEGGRVAAFAPWPATTADGGPAAAPRFLEPAIAARYGRDVVVRGPLDGAGAAETFVARLELSRFEIAARRDPPIVVATRPLWPAPPLAVVEDEGGHLVACTADGDLMVKAPGRPALRAAHVQGLRAATCAILAPARLALDPRAATLR